MDEQTILWMIILFTALFAVILVLAGYFSWRQTKNIRILLGKEAKKRNGQVNKRWGNTELVFPYQDVSVTVQSTFNSEYSPPQTVVTALINNKASEQFKISRRIWGLGRFLERNIISSGNSEFDNMFAIKGNDEHVIGRLVSLDVRQRLLDLEKRHPEMKLKGNNLSLTLAYIPKTEEEYDQAIDTILLLVDTFKNFKQIV